MSKASVVGLAKIGNAELAYFSKQMLIHELIRGSLDRAYGKSTQTINRAASVGVIEDEVNKIASSGIYVG